MKTIKICAIVLTIIISLFLLNSITKADIANINLKITGTDGTCVYGSTSNLGSTAFSYSAQILSGAFTGTTATDSITWRCHDSNGSSSWNLSMIMEGDLVNAINPLYTISSGAISYANYPVHQQVGSGTCTSITGASTGISDWRALNISQKVLEKISATGEVCRVQTTGLFLKVEIPGWTVPGAYSGTIIITTPDF